MYLDDCPVGKSDIWRGSITPTRARQYQTSDQLFTASVAQKTETVIEQILSTSETNKEGTIYIYIQHIYT